MGRVDMVESARKIAWAITGAGHFLPECVEMLGKLSNADVFLSKAAEEVLKMYDLEEKITKNAPIVIRDHMASAPIVGRFAKGTYCALVIAPATSNSVAKFVYGIADSLISNLFAQAGKSLVPIIVLPTDVEPELNSKTPRGNVVKVYPRPIDLENVERLKSFPHVTVVLNTQDLEKCLNIYL
jgi:flavoprotein